MAFFFTCGTHKFRSALAGYENVTVQCQNCGNFTGKVIKNWYAHFHPPAPTSVAIRRIANTALPREWFTLCFVPLIPFSLKPWHAVHCNVCNFEQDLKYRPDVEQQMQGGGQAIPMQNQGNQQGWNRPPGSPGQPGPPGQGGVPQYK
ncbi:hypothetical protein LTR53_004862 [Teratosphaeriaceae sp. CCFEE 6253]|nr:hypothetical protein LTR53_004862 [Teratosphaeriaceae sp. CCFEE 6253]